MADRQKIERTRPAVTTSFKLGDAKGYLTVGMYATGAPAEVFIRMTKHGSTIQGVLDSLSIVTSHALQHGVPLETIINALKDQSYEPAGFTGDPDVPTCRSISDYVARKLATNYAKFLPKDYVL